METTSELSQTVMWFSLVVGTLCVLVGLILTLIDAKRNATVAGDAAKAAKKAAEKVELGSTTETELAAQGAIGDTLESLSKLASSLKDLDIGTRVLVLGVAFYAIAGIAAGLDAIGAGLAAPS